MKVREVIVKYHKLVPFPWTPGKIKRAGFNTTQLLLDLGGELKICEDADSDRVKELLKTLKDLDMLT